MSAAAHRERHNELRTRVAETVDLAYSGRIWSEALKDVGVPLLLDLGAELGACVLELELLAAMPRGEGGAKIVGVDVECEPA